MARTYRHLWDSVACWSNLLSAYTKCRRGKRYKPAATEFDYAWELRLRTLLLELRDGSYRPGEYHNFLIYEPKQRLISAAPFRDRIVHHAIVNVLEPIFERQFIFDSYACRRGKGTHAALERAQGYLRQYPFYLKTDIVRFFPNVDHEILFAQIRRRVDDQRLLELIGWILNSGEHILKSEASQAFFPGDDLFSLLRPKGLPIGNLTSQFFANVLLDQLDHYIKEDLRIPGYVRYSDDLLLVGTSKRLLWEQLDQIKFFLAGLRLRLHSHKTVVAPCERRIDFLGFSISSRTRRLSQTGIRRFNRNLRKMKWLYKQGRISSEKIRMSLQAWNAHADFGNVKGLKKRLWRRVKFTKPARRVSGSAPHPRTTPSPGRGDSN